MSGLTVKPIVEPAVTDMVDAATVEAPMLQRISRDVTSVTGSLV